MAYRSLARRIWADQSDGWLINPFSGRCKPGAATAPVTATLPSRLSPTVARTGPSMSLLSVLKRDREHAAETASDALDPVQRARTLARRRLLGALVLLAIGVVALPALLETQPRPIPVDIPIEIPRKEAAAPLSLPAANRAAGKVAPVITEREGDSGRDLAQAARADDKPVAAPHGDDGKPVVKADPSSARSDTKPDTKPDTKSDTKPDTKAEQRPAVMPGDRKSAPKADAVADHKPAAKDGAAVAAKPAGKDSAGKPEAAAAPAAGTARFVVQAGAFADANAASAARAKIERLGIRTYMQEIQTAQGKRLRVRVGPFATRNDADAAVARIRSVGLAPAVLALPPSQ